MIIMLMRDFITMKQEKTTAGAEPERWFLFRE